MSIVIEEKKPTNWVAILGGIILVVLVFGGAYYLFFKKPEIIEVVAPGSLQDIKRISTLKFKPDSVIQNPIFSMLRREPVVSGEVSPGKSNPFKPF